MPLFPTRTRVRRRRTPAAGPEVLESRALLSATGTRVITAAENGQAVTVDTTEFGSVIVEAGADIGTLTIQGSECDVDVDILGSASSLNVQGGSGAERVFLREGGTLGQVTFQGGDGADLLGVSGVVEGSLTFNGDGDTDLLRIRNAGEVRGGISGSGGAGRDGFDVFDSAIVDNVNFDLGEGDDRGRYSSTEATTGNFNLTTGDGNDTIQFGEGFTIGGNQSTDLGDGDDLLITRGMTVEGNQTLDAGAGEGDIVRLGGDTIEGGSTLNYSDGLLVRETAARDVQSDYSVVSQNGSGEATVLLDEGSTVGGNLTVNTNGESTVLLDVVVMQGNATINTGTGSGSGADLVRLLGGTAVGGNVTVTLGGDEADVDQLLVKDGVRVGDPEAGTNGNFNAALGGGADVYVEQNLLVNGNQSVDLGPTPGAEDGEEDGEGGGEAETVRLDGGEIFGSSSFTAGGAIDLAERAARSLMGDYTITAGAGDSDVRLRETTLTNSGNFVVTAAGPLRLVAPVVVESGNATVNAGAGDDVINLQGLMTGDTNLTVNLAAGDDIVRLDGTTVGGNLNVAGGEGRDVVRNGGVSVTGTASYDGGSGDDDRIEIREGEVSGFEN